MTVIDLKVTLSTEHRPVQREVERRWRNALPFMLAFYFDGKAVERPDTWRGQMRFSDVSMVPLVEKGKIVNWTLQVKADSLRALVANGGRHTLAIGAAFSNLEHVGYSYATQPARLPEPFDIPQIIRGPQIVVRSNLAVLESNATTWEPIELGADHRR